MTFAWAWCFALLPLPWLARRWLAPAECGVALRVPSLPALAKRPAAAAGPHRLATLAWLLLVLAAARPQMPGTTVPQALDGRDLMLAFDVSASMATTDLLLDGRAVTRLAAARHFADGFLAARAGDRIGLVVFGSQAYLHTPLTRDLAAIRAALATADVGLAGRETALGDAIALSIKHLPEAPGLERTLILLSDGANTAGKLTPERAGWLARRAGLRIHAVVIGGDGKAPGLEALVAPGGGIHARATDAAALADFWRRIDAVEPAAPDALRRPAQELYAWPLAAALMLAAVLTFMRLRVTNP